MFTKDKCYYCLMLKEKLDEWEIEYEVLNNHPLPDGHKTYPQLYYRGVDIQQGASTDVSRQDIFERVERIEWPSIDSGIE